MNEKILYYIWLSSTLRAGSKTPKLLLEHYGSIEKIYNAGKEEYKALSVPSGEISALCNKNLDDAKHHYKYCSDKKIGILCYDDPYYPERLKIIDNPPPMFYFQGKLCQLDDYPCVTMVGTRSCSERGFRLAYESGFDAAAKGAVIINGLALGIDGACISGALDASGYAVGILGCGIDRIYPYGNKELFSRLSETGLILSEFPLFSEPRGTNFPIRNRVMSALSLATVIFEASSSSGAMITAKYALEQGRRIFAVPAKPYDKNYSGALELIKDGASVFTESDDILTEYSMSFPHRINLANKAAIPQDKLNSYVAKYFKKDVDPDTPVNRRFLKKRDEKKTKEEKKALFAEEPANDNEVKKEEKAAVKASVQETKSISADLSMLSVTEKTIYEVLVSYGSLTADEISEKGVKIDDILSALTLLEIYGLVRAKPGGKYELI